MHEMNTSGSGAYTLDDNQKLVIRPDGTKVRVTVTGFNLLKFLHEHSGRLFTTVELLELVWGTPWLNRTNVDHQVSTLRKRAGWDVIDTVPNYGYGVGIELV